MEKKLKLSNYLKKFIEGLREDENEQLEILEICGPQAAAWNLENANPRCPKCGGRGFTGYNSVFKELVPCSKRCFLNGN